MVGLFALFSFEKAGSVGEGRTAGLWMGGRESCRLAPGLGSSTLQAPVLLRSQLLHGWVGLALFPLPYLQTLVICTPICGQMASRLAPGHPAWRGGGLLKLVSGNLGWSPRWGVSPWRKPGPESPLGL